MEQNKAGSLYLELIPNLPGKESNLARPGERGTALFRSRIQQPSFLPYIPTVHLRF